MKKGLSLILVIVLLMGLFPLDDLFAAAAEASSPMVSENIGYQDYAYYQSRQVNSYLYEDSNGTLLRVEALQDSVVVERYNADFTYRAHIVIPNELPIFGGFYVGTDFLFLVFGQANTEEDDSKEVIRVVRYKKNWVRLDHVSLYGSNTRAPFNGGSLRMTQYGDMLYVHTCHTMYTTSDDLSHQANMIFSVHIPTMKITDQQTDISKLTYGYVSHSFNQFVLTDGDRLLTLNHGDAYPRSAVIVQYGKPAGQQTFTGKCTNLSVLDFYGKTGQNATGATLGAFELSGTSMLVAGSSVVQDGSQDVYFGQRNIFITATPRGNIGSKQTTFRWITNHAGSTTVDISTPHLLCIRDDYFILLWTEDGLTHYVFVDGTGKPVSRIYEADVPLSDCKPIVLQNKVCWYTTNQSAPVFFTISLDDPTQTTETVLMVHLTLDPGRGTLDNNIVDIPYGQPIGTLPIPQCDTKYRFLGWYSCGQGSGSKDYSDYLITEDLVAEARWGMTLYAHWVYQEHPWVSTVTKEPTEWDSGILTAVCPECDGVSITVTLPRLSESFYHTKVTREATCAQYGEKRFTWKTRTYGDLVFYCSTSRKAHDNELTQVVPPNCTDDGYEVYTCRNCGYISYGDDIPHLGHDREYQVLIAPTLTAKGELRGECSRCGDIHKMIMPALNDLDYTLVITKEPSCQSAGWGRYTWKQKYYGSHTFEAEVPALPHNYEPAITAPTCTENGYTTHTCSACKDSFIDSETAALGHAWDDGIVTKVPTCTNPGVMTFACNRCDSEKTESVAPTGHSYQSVVTAPTCTEKGYTMHTCTGCGDRRTDNETAALGHAWDDGVVTKAPTCAASGVKTFACNRCGSQKTESIAPTGHSYQSEVTAPTCTETGYTTYTCIGCGHSYRTNPTNALGHSYTSVVTAPTCTQKGYTTHICTGCGDRRTDNETAALGHAWDDGLVTKAPTCAASGVKTFTCNRCGSKKTESIAPTDHSYQSKVTAPTCTEAGYTTYTCIGCGHSYRTNPTNALGHSYTSVVTAPTCTQKGYTTHICTGCGDRRTDNETAALGHAWDDGVVTKAPTCAASGVKTFTCNRCGSKKTESIAPTDHSYQSKVTAPTCTEAGYTTFTCAVCGHSYRGNPTNALGHSYFSEVIAPTCTEKGLTIHTCTVCWDIYIDSETAALGHAWSEGNVTAIPTCTEAGTRTISCDRCALIKTESIPATGHSYEATVTLPTCTEAGYTTYTCIGCGHSYRGNPTNALGHSYSSEVIAPTCTEKGLTIHTCTVCWDIYIDSETAALGHAWSEGSVTAEPTCTEAGTRTIPCDRCALIKTESIPATGHSYEATVTLPTCAEAGYTTHTCSVCDYSYRADEIAPLGHDYVASTAFPTCTEGGYTSYLCSRCGDGYRSDETAPYGHSWDDGVIIKEPTATEEGIRSYTCIRCGESRTETIPAVGATDSCDGGPNCPSAVFEDVDTQKWYHNAIDYALNNGLMNGTGNNKFEPDSSMTRAMLVTVLWRYAGEPSDGENIFTDVEDNRWYSKAVAWAGRNGIVGGVGDGRFDPNGEITREQMATILYRYSKSIGIDVSMGADLTGFPDGDKVSAYAKESVAWAVAEGLITGSKENGTLWLDPQGNATRAQVATILMRFIENLSK